MTTKNANKTKILNDREKESSLNISSPIEYFSSLEKDNAKLINDNDELRKQIKTLKQRNKLLDSQNAESLLEIDKLNLLLTSLRAIEKVTDVERHELQYNAKFFEDTILALKNKFDSDRETLERAVKELKRQLKSEQLKLEIPASSSYETIAGLSMSDNNFKRIQTELNKNLFELFFLHKKEIEQLKLEVNNGN